MILVDGDDERREKGREWSIESRGTIYRARRSQTTIHVGAGRWAARTIYCTNNSGAINRVATSPYLSSLFSYH